MIRAFQAQGTLGSKILRKNFSQNYYVIVSRLIFNLETMYDFRSNGRENITESAKSQISLKKPGLLRLFGDSGSSSFGYEITDFASGLRPGRYYVLVWGDLRSPKFSLLFPRKFSPRGGHVFGFSSRPPRKLKFSRFSCPPLGGIFITFIF